VFVLSIVCIVLALIALIVRLTAQKSLAGREGGHDRRPVASWVAGILGAFAALFLFLSCIAIVGTKEVGIVTAFNRPVGAFDNGFHVKAPWEDVTEMDAAIQTDTHAQQESSCVQARIAHQIVACADVTVRWRIQESAADELFRDYRDFSNVRASLVTRQLATDINTAFQDYDPLAVDGNGNSTAPSLSDLAAAVLRDMQGQISAQVNVLSVFIPVLHFDQATQSRINALQAQIAQTRIQAQAVATAEQQAAANQKLAASVSTNPNVLVSKCLDILNEMVNKNQGIPAGFSCWPGGGTGVVIPSAK
jgi:regulator of protease activity HflC (stomatin/prohibitin superfamily)